MMFSNYSRDIGVHKVADKSVSRHFPLIVKVSGSGWSSTCALAFRASKG